MKTLTGEDKHSACCLSLLMWVVNAERRALQALP